jgi:hypothetical protein
MIVPDNSCFLQKKQRKEAHTIISDQLIIPLKLRGVISYFNVRCPTEEEVLNPDRYQHITMTAPSEWDPYDSQLTEIEDTLTTQKDNITSTLQIGDRIISMTENTHV